MTTFEGATFELLLLVLVIFVLHVVAVLWAFIEARARRHPHPIAILMAGIGSFFFLPGIGAAIVIAWTLYDLDTGKFTRNPPISQAKVLEPEPRRAGSSAATSQ